MSISISLEKPLIADEEADKSFKAKSAGSISRRATAATAVRSMTSVTLKRNKISDKQEKSEAKNTTKIKNLKEIIPKTDGKPSSISPSKFTKYIEKQAEEERNTKSANSRILKPIGSTFKEKSNIQNKTESRENSQNNLTKGKATSAGSSKKDSCLKAQQNVSSNDGEIVTSPKEKRSDASAKIKAAERGKFEDDKETKGEKDDSGNDRLLNESSKQVKDLKECEYLLVVQKYCAR